MMNKLKFMNGKEKKKFIELLIDQFGFKGELNYHIAINEKNKVYIVNDEISRIELDKIKINTFGLYIGELNDNEIRLSIDGSQIIGPHCSHNVLEITEAEKVKWLKGEEVYYDYQSTKYIIIKSGDDYLGCGKKKDDRILNYVSKTRRIKLTEDFQSNNDIDEM